MKAGAGRRPASRRGLKPQTPIPLGFQRLQVFGGARGSAPPYPDKART